jgi:16S rRNA (guanine527-N7)-methyltransferase
MNNLHVSHETLLALKEYASILIKWNKKISLISNNDLDNIWERHILDSLQLLKFIESDDHVVDVGSGAGLPGIILSLIGIKHVTLIESDARKAAFLLQVSTLSKNRIEILNARVENLSLECDILTSRGFASIKNTLDLCKCIGVKKKILLMKGEQAIEEINEAKKLWHFRHDIKPSITHHNGCIVELVKL